jgi:hypothetical protein
MSKTMKAAPQPSVMPRAMDVSDAAQKSQRWPSAIRLKVGDMTGFYAEFQGKFIHAELTRAEHGDPESPDKRLFHQWYN